MRMIDVSSLQHVNNQPINWCYVEKSGVQAVMVKATEGVGYINPWLERDARNAEASGLFVGYYHYCHPGSNSPSTEVDYFARAIAPLKHQLGLAMDLEVTEGLTWPELADWGHQFLDMLALHTAWPIMYSNENFLTNMAGAPWGHRLWYASPSRRPRRQVWAWQNGTITVPGVPDQVDSDVLYEIPSV